VTESVMYIHLAWRTVISVGAWVQGRWELIYLLRKVDDANWAEGKASVVVAGKGGQQGHLLKETQGVLSIALFCFGGMRPGNSVENGRGLKWRLWRLLC
jgi:hypothetical protein